MMAPRGSINIHRYRLIFFSAIVLFLVPVVVAGITYQDPLASGGNSGDLDTHRNVTFLSVQGVDWKTGHKGETARIVAVDTDTKDVIWTHDQHRRYFDVDPIGADRLLFAAASKSGGREMNAYLYNWRTDERLLQFDLPQDNHDVDRINETTYVYVGRYTDSIHVYDTTRENVTWRYDLKNHFPKHAGKDDDYVEDYSHLNDVDLVADGSAFLISPRNFNTVVLVNRSTKETVWTLGTDDQPETLNRQHNPVLLSMDPPTVLVADSNNNRIVEYRRSNGTWNVTWQYPHVDWPRDADRLPNGNTLIADTHDQRFLEVAPNGSTVWQMNATHWPYDIERIQYGDEPAGPTLVNATPVYPESTEREGVIGGIVGAYTYAHTMALWVLPAWVSSHVFGSLLGACLVAIGWIGAECQQWRKRRNQH
jgi:hypothetical protein